MATAKIRTEEDAWALLERVRAGAPPPDEIDVSDWNPELLYFPDAARGHVISPTTARAVTEFHKSLQRGYAEIVYGSPNARLLKARDLERLELEILVTDGSNGLKAIGDAIENLTSELAAALADKMTPEQITNIVLAFLLLYFGSSVAKQWIASAYRKKQKEVDANERMKLSEQETERLQIMASVVSEYKTLATVREEANEAHEALVRPATASDRTRVVGTEITADEAKVIVSKEVAPIPS